MSEIIQKRRCEMRILGLTGSIGMGKSTTAKLFAEAGVPVYDADAAVHKIYEGEAAPAIEAAFPGTTVDGKVDRAKLSAKVVHDPAAIKQLEQIVHPMLGASRQKFLDDAERSGAPVVVMDIPLLFETGGEKRVDAVVVVTTSPEAQRERILARGTMTTRSSTPSWRGNCPMPKSASARISWWIRRTDSTRCARKSSDILAEVVKMPQRRT